jgi:hypothetical protein
MLVERVCVVKTLTQAFHIVYHCGYLCIHACIQRDMAREDCGNSLFDEQVRIHTSHLSSC